MKPELSIKLDYLDDRQNPAEIFEAMAGYINAYRDFGQLLSGSVGFNTDFEFQLSGIEEGSILSKLSALSGRIDQVFEAAFYNSGNDLFDELTNVDITESEEQVEELAAGLETSLVENLPQQIAHDKWTVTFRPLSPTIKSTSVRKEGLSAAGARAELRVDTVGASISVRHFESEPYSKRN